MKHRCTPRVLIVEDNATNLELAVALVEQEGCEVLVAETADAGIPLARTGHPDLILMDLQLPGMTGYEATRRLKADPATAGIPVVAVTAQAMPGDETRAAEAGCDGYMTKPVGATEFHEMLRRFLSEDTHLTAEREGRQGSQNFLPPTQQDIPM